MDTVRLLEVGGVPVEAHWTLLVLLVGVGLWLGAAIGVQGALTALLAVALTLLSVLWHELGHTWAAQWCGVPVRGVVLMPLGGVTQLGVAWVSPRTDVIVSLAGPLASIALAGLAAALWGLTGVGVLWLVAGLNAVLGGFNLLPAFPLDGGRAVRSWLVPHLGLARATRITLGSGLGLAMALVVIAWQATLPGALIMAVYLVELQRQEWRAVQAADA